MSDPILHIGISPCPNDTFIFEEWILADPSSWITPPRVTFADVQSLNEMALDELVQEPLHSHSGSPETDSKESQGSVKKCPDVLKISAATWASLNKNPAQNPWQLLNCGGAMGYGCGPLLLSSQSTSSGASALNPDHPVLLPGKNTTATLLYRFWLEKYLDSDAKQADPGDADAKSTRGDKSALFSSGHSGANSIPYSGIPEEFCFFDDLYQRLKNRTAHQGVVIHESRFLWEQDQLHLIADLGAFWEEHTQSPIPLGVIVARKSLGADIIAQVESQIRESLAKAWHREQMVTPFIRSKAQEMEEDVMGQHIKTFVNEFSMDIGEAGHRALVALEQYA